MNWSQSFRACIDPTGKILAANERRPEISKSSWYTVLKVKKKADSFEKAGEVKCVYDQQIKCGGLDASYCLRGANATLRWTFGDSASSSTGSSDGNSRRFFISAPCQGDISGKRFYFITVLPTRKKVWPHSLASGYSYDFKCEVNVTASSHKLRTIIDRTLITHLKVNMAARFERYA